MRITTTRRVSQIFFFLLFLWFCVVSTLGEQWWQLRGWPVNWLIQLDPLVGLATVLTTGTLYSGLLWGLLTLSLTLVLGRFFCGWICPFGALHQVVGWLANRKKKVAGRIDSNRYRRGQNVKYLLLAFLLAAASGDLLGFWTDSSRLLVASLQTGLLDPIPLFYRSVNLALLPLLDGGWIPLGPVQRMYPGAWLIGFLFLVFVLLNLVIPRFYCRFLCPLGALFGLLGRNAIWRIGHQNNRCTSCKACDQYCEGGCEPSATLRSHECLLCMNCLTGCGENVIGFGLYPSIAGEVPLPDLSRRAWVSSVVLGVAAIPFARLEGWTGRNWNPSVVRPPGSLAEEEFLQRCIKCGQCMRVCPTNVIQPTGLASGIEGLWTPSLNFRMGTSGCQQTCIACGNLCPTAAIRPITLDERLGTGTFAPNGPIRIGTAFLDHGRCLPWSMDRPCIVCQENCPVSPKAISVRDSFREFPLAGPVSVQSVDGNDLIVQGPPLPSSRISSGDYFVSLADRPGIAPVRILGAIENSITLASNPFAGEDIQGAVLRLSIKLQLPFVEPSRCIGCGVCEHECPVKGRRAIRVTAENETREREHALVL